MRYIHFGSIFLILALTLVAPAQTDVAAVNRNAAFTESAGLLDSTPFKRGESLSYEAKFSKSILRGAPAADLVMTVVSEPGAEILIKADASSKGTLLKLFRYSFLQQYRSIIDPQRFRALKTTKHDVQKERVRDSEAVFDYGERRVTFLETDPNDPMKPPRRIASEIEDQTHDLISGLYALRIAPLAVGKTIKFRVSDSGLVYEVPVKVTGREVQKTIFGKVTCFRIEPLIFGPGRMIEREGNMVVWITDDERRLPVRSVVETSFGKIDIRLKTAQNLK